MGVIWVYPLLAGGADLGWVMRRVLKGFRKFTTGFFFFFNYFLKGIWMRVVKQNSPEAKHFHPSEPTVTSLQS